MKRAIEWKSTLAVNTTDEAIVLNESLKEAKRRITHSKLYDGNKYGKKAIKILDRLIKDLNLIEL